LKRGSGNSNVFVTASDPQRFAAALLKLDPEKARVTAIHRDPQRFAAALLKPRRRGFGRFELAVVIRSDSLRPY